MKLNQGVEIHVDKEKQTITFVQLASENNKAKLEKEFAWLNNEFLCAYEVK